MKKLLLVVGALLLWGCVPGGKSPQPPHQTPTPTLPGMPLLKVVGSQFVPPILGSVTTHAGWPLVNATALDAIAAAGLNYTAMRIPCELDDRPGYDVYMRAPDGRADLTRFNPAFDNLLTQTLKHAHEDGIYVNLGLVDGWCAVHITELNSPLKAAGNVNSVDIGSCTDFQQAPHSVWQAQVNHIVSIAARFPNVIWELGNEANRCHPASAFIDGIRSVVRAAETANGFARHLWSPGTFEAGALGSEFDFVSQHGDLVAVGGVAVEVNEFSPQDKATYLANLARFRSLGNFSYWHDDSPVHGESWDSPRWEQEWLDTMKAMRSTTPTTGCTNIPNHDAVAASPRPPADPAISAAINTALAKVTGCAPQSGCEINEPMQSFFAKVTQAIRDEGMCAGVQDDSEGLVDQICVGTEQRCQGNHIYTCNAGCATGKVGWASGSYTNRNGDTWVR